MPAMPARDHGLGLLFDLCRDWFGVALALAAGLALGSQIGPLTVL